MFPRLKLPPMEPQYVIQTMADAETYDWGLMDLNIPNAHKQTMGEGIKIGVIDSGKSEHFETAPNIADAINMTATNTCHDKVGHATFVTGLIAAGKNGTGIIGVAPEAKIYAAKAMDDSGNGDPAWMVNAIKWCIDQDVDIISISAGMFFDFKPMHEVIKLAYSKNIITIAAVGNTGNRYFDVAFPARYPEVIGVAAYDRTRQAAPFSSRGINVKFSLPGVDIYSTYLNNTYAKMSGSSFSAPILSGICALILSKHRKFENKTPCETPQQMLEHLRKYSINLGDPNAYGFGTINLDLAVKDI